jgi:hypothetical protein
MASLEANCNYMVEAAHLVMSGCCQVAEIADMGLVVVA